MIKDNEISDTLDSLKFLAIKMTKSIEDAEDLLQETSIKVFKNKEKYDSSYGKLTTWIGTIMKNTNLDNYRKDQKKDIFINESKLVNGITDSILKIKSVDYNEAHDNISYEDLIETINYRVTNTIDKDLFLKQVQGYKLKELAEIYDMNINTVKGRIRKVRLLLQKFVTKPK